MNPTPKKRSKVLPALFVVVLGGVLWGGYREDGWFREGETEQAVGSQVQRGPLRVTVMQRGNLSAKNSARVTSQLEGRNQILWLIEEGTQVEAGDLVAELDVSQLEDRLVEQDISVQNAAAALTKAEQELEIQISQNVSDIAKAEQNLLNAKKEKEKYEKGDWPKRENELKDAIAQAEAAEAKAADDLEWTQKLFDEGFETRTRLVQDQINAQSAKIRKDQAVADLEVEREFEYPKQIRELTAAVEEANRELDRVNLQATARLVDKQAAERTSRAKYQLEASELEELKGQVEKAKLYAPAPGMVVYAREDGGWRGDGDIIREGTEVRERQEVVTIPQSGGMVAEASLHESIVKKVKPGMPVTVRVDSIPGQEFPGKVGFVALLPDKGSRWTNPDLRVFRTTIEIVEGSPDMRPDMSCSVEILVDEIEDTLFVPVQAVFPTGGKSVCFVDDEAVEVETGASTDKWMQILSGLEEGQIVSLSPPADFMPEPAPANEAPEESAPGDGMGQPGSGQERPAGAGGEGMRRPGGGQGQRPGGGNGGG